jgi:hypothetical protein
LLQDNKISQTQENFKQEVRDEIDQLRQLLLSTNSLGNPKVQSVAINTVPTTSSTVSSRNNQVSLTTPILDTSNPSVTLNAGMSSNDVQSHMMLMLTESFTKLSTVLGKKNSRPYLLIVVQISIPPWQEFYDSNTNSIVKTTHNTALNSKLYAKLLVSLEGQALQDVVSRSHLRANGILLLHELVQTYHPC